MTPALVLAALCPALCPSWCTGRAVFTQPMPHLVWELPRRVGCVPSVVVVPSGEDKGRKDSREAGRRGGRRARATAPPPCSCFANSFVRTLPVRTLPSHLPAAHAYAALADVGCCRAHLYITTHPARHRPNPSQRSTLTPMYHHHHHPIPPPPSVRQPL
mgnify:CR=1 FL=1